MTSKLQISVALLVTQALLTKNELIDRYEVVLDNAVKRLLPRQQLGDMGRKISGFLYIDHKMMKWNDIFCTLFSLKGP